jgi:hypothetical protein
VSKETMLHLRASKTAELLLFDWPKEERRSYGNDGGHA